MGDLRAPDFMPWINDLQYAFFYSMYIENHHTLPCVSRFQSHLKKNDNALSCKIIKACNCNSSICQPCLWYSLHPEISLKRKKLLVVSTMTISTISEFPHLIFLYLNKFSIYRLDMLWKNMDIYIYIYIYFISRVILGIRYKISALWGQSM